MDFLDSKAIATIATVLGSVLTVCITYYKIKQIKFFDVYFSKKTEAYSEYWEAFSTCYKMENKEDAFIILRSKAYKLAMLAPYEVYLDAFNLAGDVREAKWENIGDKAERLTCEMRKDLMRCKNLKF